MLKNAPLDTQTWWRYGHVWLVIAGPLLVVIASVVSAVIAFQGNDIEVQSPTNPSVTSQKSATAPGQNPALASAIQGRNHAATSAP